MEVATFKKDDKILLHIRDRDCVAIEVRYHAACYRRVSSNCWSSDCYICEEVILKENLRMEESDIFRIAKLSNKFNAMLVNANINYTFGLVNIICFACDGYLPCFRSYDAPHKVSTCRCSEVECRILLLRCFACNS